MHLRASSLLPILLLAGCAGPGGPTGQATDNLLHGLLTRQPLGRSLGGMSYAEVYSGVAWDRPYTIQRSPGDRYILVSGNSRRTVANAGPMSHVYGTRTGAMSVDAFLTADAPCPDRYVAVIGNGGGLHSQSLGCASPLQFERGGHERVYATETEPPQDSEPLAYEIGTYSVANARPVSQLRDHPQYLAYQRGRSGNRQALVLRPAQNDAAPESVGRTTTAAPPAAAQASMTPPAQRLPLPQEIHLPDEVPDSGPVTTRPVVDLGSKD